MGRFGKWSHLEGCKCDHNFTCGQCLRLAGPTIAPAVHETKPEQRTNPSKGAA